MKRMLSARGLALALCLAIPAIAPQAQAQVLSAPQEDAVRAIVRDFILRNPEILVEALNALEEKQKAEAASGQVEALRRVRADLLQDPGSPAIGPANADAVLVQFFDYRCPYCKQVAEPVIALARADPRLRVVFKELPILGPDSVVASRAALAAAMQGQYQKFHLALMARRGSLDEASVLALAKESGLDQARLRADMAKPEVMAQVERNRALARDLGIRGTPAFVIGDEIVPGAIDIETMRQLVARARGR
jgi:protein-disulfide isomerase